MAVMQRCQQYAVCVHDTYFEIAVAVDADFVFVLLWKRGKQNSLSITHAPQGQSVVASRAIAAATGNGSWVLLQNCHLGLDYMETMEDYVQVLSKPSVLLSSCSCVLSPSLRTNSFVSFSASFQSIFLQLQHDTVELVSLVRMQKRARSLSVMLVRSGVCAVSAGKYSSLGNLGRRVESFISGCFFSHIFPLLRFGAGVR